MNVISFITMLQEYPIVGLLIALGLFVFLFGVKNLIIWFFSKQAEAEKQQNEENRN